MSTRILEMRRAALGVLGLGALAAMTGCAGFFVDQNSSTSSSGSNTGDYVYVANQTQDTLTGYAVTATAFTAVTGSPASLLAGLSPASVEVSRSNKFVYVGGAGAIECFSISSTGTLALVNRSAVSSLAKFVSLATSPDGQWLLALDGLTQTLYSFGINATTSALTLAATAPYTAAGPGTVVPTMVRVAPDGDYVLAALGTGGDVVFTFNTTTGAPAQVATLAVPTSTGDNAVTIDANSAYVYFARGGTNSGSSGVASYKLGTGGSLTAVQTLAVSGNAPFSVILDSTGGFVYTANRADGTISGYSVSSGTLTALTGSPYSSGSLVTSLARDNSGKYLIAGAFAGSSDLTLYSFDATTSGKLDQAATSTSGTDPAGSIAIAATH